MSKRHDRLYLKNIMTKSKPSVVKEPPMENLSDYSVDHILSFIPKSKFLDTIIDERNNGKVHRVSRR